MGKLELPLPKMRKGSQSFETAAKKMQARIRSQVPPELKDSVVVRMFSRGTATGLAIEYDDRAENYVYMAMEYPKKKRGI